MIDRHPAVIARCTGVADVQAALAFGLEQDLPIAVRGGGHNVAGKAVVTDGLVIDLAPMKGIWVDPIDRLARAQAGLTWGEFDRETQVYGLATTGGAISTTGIAGLTLGGGIGWQQRRHGLTCDNLVSADVITADGRLLTANDVDNPDLSGVCVAAAGTSASSRPSSTRLHPVGEVGPDRSCTRSAPLAMSSASTASSPSRLRTTSSASSASARRRTAVGRYSSSSSTTGLRRRRRRCRARTGVREPDRGHAGADELLRGTAGVRRGLPVRAAQLLEVEQRCRADRRRDRDDHLVHGTGASSSPLVIIDQFGGAVARVPSDATAFGHRDAAYDLIIAAIWSDPAEQDDHIEWAKSFWEAMQPYSTGEVYVNYLSDEGEERVRSAYGHQWERLVELKRAYDPQNVFRANQNIAP